MINSTLNLLKTSSILFLLISKLIFASAASSKDNSASTGKQSIIASDTEAPFLAFSSEDDSLFSQERKRIELPAEFSYHLASDSEWTRWIGNHLYPIVIGSGSYGTVYLVEN